MRRYRATALLETVEAEIATCSTQFFSRLSGDSDHNRDMNRPNIVLRWFAEFVRKGGHKNLTLWILIALLAAVAVALSAPETAMKFHVGGEVFLNLLKMLVVPLVVTSVMSGIFGMGDVRKLGKPGGAAIGYYLCTTVLAVLVGLVVVNMMQPGGAVDPDKVAEIGQGTVDEESPKYKVAKSIANETGLTMEEVGSVLGGLPAGEAREQNIGDIIENLFLMLVTDNLFKAAMEMELLPLIVFSIVFAGVLTTMGKQVDGLINLIEQSNTALMKVILLLMKLAPVGIFCLVAARFGEAEHKGEFVEQLTQIGRFVGTVIVGLGFHFCVTLPLILWFITKRNPYRFMLHMSQALLTAFSTASSSATLPITMKSAIEKAKVSRESTEFVLPLGATINMDGTALYEAAAVLFIAQAIGQDLSFGQQVVVAITATLAAIGAAGIPEAGLITMLIVLRAVDLPTEYIALILPVDWFLDRFRTATNVFGDSIGAAVVETTMPKPTSAH